MTLAVYSSTRRLGRITLAGGRLAGTSPGIQDVADAAVRRAGGDAAAAYAALDGYSNGYVTVAALPGGGLAAAWDEREHPRVPGGAGGGQFTNAPRGGPTPEGKLPPDPGTRPIPPGHIRLWHYTPLKNTASIRRVGLGRKYARGDAGNYDLTDPSAGVWASTRRPDDILNNHESGAAVIEFHAPPGEISQNAESPWHAATKGGGWDDAKVQDWASGYHHVIMRGDVPPEAIVDIHEPWHGAARYMRDDDPTLASYQWLKEPANAADPIYAPYVRGLRALEAQRPVKAPRPPAQAAAPAAYRAEENHPGCPPHLPHATVHAPTGEPVMCHRTPGEAQDLALTLNTPDAAQDTPGTQMQAGGGLPGQAAAFREEQHPRIPGGKGGGRFTRTSGGGEDGAPLAHVADQGGSGGAGDWHADFVVPASGAWTPDLTPAKGVKALTSKGRAGGAGTPDDPVDVQGNLDKALILLHQGKHVRLNQVDEVALLLRKVDGIARRAAAKGTKPPDWDFGLLTVAGTNLFTAQHKGIPRISMPQFSGLARPGTPAAARAGGAGRFADMTPEFAASLRRDGVKVTNGRVPVAHLRATQTELVGSKVAGFAAAVLRGDPKAAKTIAEPIYVTRDHYVIDGHHRWAANMMLDSLDGTLGNDTYQNVRIVDMDIGAAIPYANDFAGRVGIGAVAGVTPATAAALAGMRADAELGGPARAFREADHPRKDDGKFTRTPGDATPGQEKAANRLLTDIAGLLGVGGQLQSAADRRLDATVGDIKDELAEGPAAADWGYIRRKLPELAAAEQDAGRRGQAGNPQARALAVKLRELRGALEAMAVGARAAGAMNTEGDGMGTGAFDPGTIAGLDRAGLDAALDDIAAAAKPNTDRNRGNAETLRRYWAEGEGALKIRWHTPGDHERCVRLLVEHAKFSEQQAHGYCNLLEKRATGLYPAQHAHQEKAGHAAAPDGAAGDAGGGEHRLPALVTITGVDILAAGTWQLSTGRQTFTRADLEDAVQAAGCPAVGAPVIKIGHLDKRFAPAPGDDGEPAIGRVANMRLAAAGDKVIGDLAGMPGWLGAIAASAFPRRSIEGKYGVTCQIGHTHRFVVTALALLGLTPPGVGVLGGLDDIARLYGVTAAAGGGAWRSEPQDQEESVMAVTEEDVRRAYYATAGAPQSWWITELQMAPTQLVVADQGTGKIYRVPFRIDDGAKVAFEQPVEIASYADVAAGRGTGPVVAYASAAESRAVTEAAGGGVSDKPWGGFTAADYTPEQWHRACLIHSHAGAPTGKGECKLPVREPDGALNRGGVHAAAAALAGARGGVQASAEEKAKAAAALRGLYAKLGEPPPESLKAAAGDEPDVEAAGDHGPHTGEHTHPHAAYGSQGGDQTHEHMHRHNNDGVHDHAHDPVSAAPPDPAAAAPAGTCAHPGHGPAAGKHTHPHPAPGGEPAAAGGAPVHDHMHEHDGDASHDHPHQPGQAPPAGPGQSAATAAASEQGGGSDVEFTAEQMAAIRQRLGKGPDDPVGPADIAAAFQQAPPPPAPVAAAAAGVAGDGPVDVPVIADGVHLVEGEILRDYQKRAVEGDRAVRAMHVAERDIILAGAIKEGKFAQSRLDHFRQLWDRDPDGTRKLVASLAPNLVPVGRPVGSNGEYGADPDMPGDFEAQQAYRQLYPDDVRGGISAAPGVRSGY